jgi:hypothetical protein
LGKNAILNKYKFTHIPIQYQTTKELDERFLEVKIYVLHLGENYNGSIFEKEVVENAIPSIANTPLLGFVKLNENDKDFSGHEVDLVVEKGEYKWKYKGQAYGVIPERNNARWESMTGTDGVEREYLVVDAIVWKKFDDATEIFSRDLIKGQSMELSEKYSGHFNDTGLFVFDQFKFDGCAILGENVEPAMNSAKVEMQFSMDNLKNSISTMLGEYNSKFKKEVDDVGIEALLKQYGFTREQVVEAGVEIHTFNDENLEAFKEELERLKSEAEAKENKADDNKEENKVENKSEDEKDESKDEEKNKEADKESSKANDESFNKEEDKGNLSENHSQDESLKEEYTKLKTDYDKLKEDYDELVTYKKNRENNDHKAKVEALINSFEKLSDTDVKEIREKVFHFTFEEIEEKLYAILGKKQASDKVKKQSQFAKFYVADDDNKQEKKSSYDHLFQKHLNK